MRNGKQLTGLVLGITMCAGTLAGQGFEGVVAMKVWSKGKATDMTMSIKGGVTRTDMVTEGHNGTMLMNPQTKTMIMIMAEEKMYMTMSLAAGEHQEHSEPKITDLGTTATIAGRECRNFLLEDAKRTTEICNGEGLGDFMMGGSPMGQGPGTDLADLASSRSHFQNGFFPLRVTRIKADKRTVQLEVTAVDPKPLDPALFQVPANFTEMKMPSMGPPSQ